MNADALSAGLIRVHPCSSAVCESCFPRKNPGKLLAGYLQPQNLSHYKKCSGVKCGIHHLQMVGSASLHLHYNQVTGLSVTDALQVHEMTAGERQRQGSLQVPLEL